MISQLRQTSTRSVPGQAGLQGVRQESRRVSHQVRDEEDQQEHDGQSGRGEIVPSDLLNPLGSKKYKSAN